MCRRATGQKCSTGVRLKHNGRQRSRQQISHNEKGVGRINNKEKVSHGTRTLNKDRSTEPKQAIHHLQQTHQVFAKRLIRALSPTALGTKRSYTWLSRIHHKQRYTRPGHGPPEGMHSTSSVVLLKNTNAHVYAHTPRTAQNIQNQLRYVSRREIFSETFTRGTSSRKKK